MGNIDNDIQKFQEDIIFFVIDNESYITEYIIIPALFELTFNGTAHYIFRSFIMSLLILRKLIISTNINPDTFAYNQLLLPFLGYAAYNNVIIKAIIFSFVYSNNFLESCFITMLSLSINSFYGFEEAYACHILYIICRNNINIILVPCGKNIDVQFNFKIKNIPQFKKRLAKFQQTIDKFINDRLNVIETE
jgi:hypothetical protein